MDEFIFFQNSASISSETTFKIMIFFGGLLFGGLVFGKLAEKVKLPYITGYLIGGVLIGLAANQFMTELVGSTRTSLDVISKIALGFIAFSIGTEMWLPKIRKSGKSIIIITVVQAFVPVIIVSVVLALLGVPLWVALPLGAIASITAPSAMLALVKKFNAKGPLTDKVFPIVGLDDALGILTFSVLLSVGLATVSEGSFELSSLAEPGKEIGLSLLVGLAIGVSMGLIVRFGSWWAKEKSTLFTTMSIVVVLVTVAISEILHLSPILTAMVVGTTFTNMIDKKTYRFEESILEEFSPPILTIFFTVAGVELGLALEIDLLKAIAFVSIIYVALRMFGKIYGGYLGSRLAGEHDHKVSKNIGKLLLPQGGVEIGLAIVIVAEFTTVFTAQGIEGTWGTGIFSTVFWKPMYVKAIVLVAIIIFGVIGPIFVKSTLIKTGEITTKGISKQERIDDKEKKSQEKEFEKTKAITLKNDPTPEDWHGQAREVTDNKQ